MPEYKTEKPRILLDEFRDFKGGHWPGIKAPPWGLNAMFLVNHPEIAEKFEAIELREGEEKSLCEAEMDVEGKRIILDIKVLKPEGRPDMIYLNAYPRE
ncbi:MAG: hypothetical protein Q7S28_02155 [bacterium]|nr:hypothetical protein [bacterium]